MTSSNSECAPSDRKWYYFLASSLVTLASGFVVILAYRFVVWLCCRKKKCKQVSNPGSTKSSNTALDQKNFKVNSDPEIGWMTEAKDWAGELISGQTTTGRILVSQINSMLVLVIKYL